MRPRHTTTGSALLPLLNQANRRWQAQASRACKWPLHDIIMQSHNLTTSWPQENTNILVRGKESPQSVSLIIDFKSVFAFWKCKECLNKYYHTLTELCHRWQTNQLLTCKSNNILSSGEVYKRDFYQKHNKQSVSRVDTLIDRRAIGSSRKSTQTSLSKDMALGCFSKICFVADAVTQGEGLSCLIKLEC